MSRILTVAESEFLTLIRSKAFIIGIFMMPALMFVFFMFMEYAQRHADPERPMNLSSLVTAMRGPALISCRAGSI